MLLEIELIKKKKKKKKKIIIIIMIIELGYYTPLYTIVY